MVRINNLQINYKKPDTELKKQAAKALNIPEKELLSYRICKKSVDARKKNDIKLVYSLLAEVKNEAKCRGAVAEAAEEYTFPEGKLKGETVVVVGAGPAGLFAALMLQRAGARVVLLERGRPVEQRRRDVESFWSGGELNTVSNVQFGEGGAGTFSDGKLTCGTGDVRLSYIIKEFIAHSAPEDIAWLAKPHIGTDRLREVVKNIRLELIALGAELHYETKLVYIKSKAGRAAAAVAECGGKTVEFETNHIVLATGHSARDTFEMLYSLGLELRPKNFAVGVRIEHLQRDISIAQYGAEADLSLLPVPDYKLVAHLDSGRSVFTFCVCPGGQVVASASEPGELVTNGMSLYARDGVNINGGLLVGITPEDFGSSHPLAGIELQRRLERAAYKLGGSSWFAPAQLVGDFLSDKPSTAQGKVTPSYRPGVTWTDLRGCMPEFIAEPLKEAIPMLGKKLKGFDCPEAVLTAVESRSSSPVHISRNERLQASIAGVYPCGEGAGFAGGIMSAAADGIHCAEMVFADLFS